MRPSRRRSHRPPAAPRKGPTPQAAETLLEGFCPEPHHDEQLAVISDGQMRFVLLSDIEWMEAADDGVTLHLGRRAHRLRDALPVVAARLPPRRFRRISHSVLVNVEHVQGLQRLIFGDYEVVLHSGKRLPLARGYSLDLLPAEPVPPDGHARATGAAR